MRRRFNIKDSLEKLYVEIPKALIYEPKYDGNEEMGIKPLSIAAKFLYGILLDRTYLSLHNAIENNDNRFVDDAGDAFIYFENAAIETILKVSAKKARAIKKELVSYELLEEVQQGLGKANKLYLNIVETKKEHLSIYTSVFQKAVGEKKEVERNRISNYRKKVKEEQVEQYGKNDRTDLYGKNDRTVREFGTSSNTELSNTDLKSVVVLVNGKEIEIDDEFRLIQLDKDKSINEKVKLLGEIEYINANTEALLYKFIEFNILVSQSQIKMLSQCVYDVAIKALDITIAQNGKSFSYFYQVYKAKEQEDIDDLANDFVFVPRYQKEN